MAYKGPLVEAVKHFQQRHGLEPNGIAGPETFKELNTPLSQRVSQLQLTLERWRWLPHEFATPPIVVNIPEFRVYAVNEQYRPAFSMKVVVGRSYKHQTPVFASEVKAVMFRPYWTVPLDIQRKELLPELRKNPSYLQKHAYEVVDSGGAVITDDGVSEAMMKQLYSGKLTIRQRPGNENSLGLLKFDMPNGYDVYMHGTPARQLFSRSRRDFSHGCIRVEDPVALAAWVLRDKPEWDSEHILAAMNGDATFRVSLSKPIPVLILYGTAIVTEGGEIHFYADIYGHDATLEQVLAKGYPYSIQ
jgi:murein L,D-transpeptidase YcbB/YkuD